MKRIHVLPVLALVVCMAAVGHAQVDNPQPQNVPHLSGKVVMADTGKPVQASLHTSNNGMRFEMRACGSTGPDGTFLLEREKLGGYLHVQPLDGRHYAVESPLPLRPGEDLKNLVFTVKPGFSLSGQVVRNDGTPAGETMVFLENPAGPPIMVPMDKQNRFTITHLPPPQDHYTLHVGQDTKVEVPAPKPGSDIKDIVIKLPAVDEGALVEGLVVDGQGEPAGGVQLGFQRLNAVELVSEKTMTDSRGRFSLKFKQAGPYMLRAWQTMETDAGGFTASIRRDCPVREGGTLVVAAKGPTQRVRVAVDLPSPELPMVAGWVEDEQEQPVEATVQAHGNDMRVQARVHGNLFLVANDGELEPFTLQFTREGHQTRVLEMGKDFTMGDRSLRVVMKKGLDAENESVQTAATDRPGTSEAVDGTGGFIQRTLAEYERLAGLLGGGQGAKEVNPSSSPPQQSVRNEVEIAVTDHQGRPVTEIMHRAAQVGSATYQSILTLENAAEAPNAPKFSQNDPGGRYRVPNLSLVWARGTAPQLVAVQSGEQHTPPLSIVLVPASSVTVRVEDQYGKPRKGIAVGRLDNVSQCLVGNDLNLPKTNADGRVRFDNLNPGYHVFVAVKSGLMTGFYEEITAVNSNWGGDVEAKIVLISPTPGSPTAMLMNLPRNRVSQELVDQKIAALDKAARREYERFVVEQLWSTPVVLASVNSRRVTLLARMATALNSRRAVEPLQAVFPKIKETVYLTDQSAEAVMEALVRLRGERMVGYFETVAGDAKVSADVRVQALIALGRIGTDKSVAAFKRLRDAVYLKYGAPELRPTYTQAERMAEAAAMILHYIPGGLGPAPTELSGRHASFSPDNSEGSMRYQYKMLHFRRFGDEWLLLRMEQLAMP